MLGNMAQLYKLVENVTLLYHEATYASDSEDRARLYYHSTAAQAARVARDAHVQTLMLGHFSSRYENEQILRLKPSFLAPSSPTKNSRWSCNPTVRCVSFRLFALAVSIIRMCFFDYSRGAFRVVA